MTVMKMLNHNLYKRESRYYAIESSIFTAVIMKLLYYLSFLSQSFTYNVRIYLFSGTFYSYSCTLVITFDPLQ